jgi:hypothetical protein
MIKNHTAVNERDSTFLLSLEGLGGAGVGGACGGKDPRMASSLKSVTASFEKNDSNLRRSFSFSSPEGAGSPIRTRASRLESWLGFSRRRAFCVASRAVGDGGRGAGFMACATVRGIVGILHDDITGSTCECQFCSQEHFQNKTHLSNPAQ